MSKPQLVVTNADGGLELSSAEYAEADFQPPWKYERAHRRVVVLPPPGHEHFLLLEKIHERLVAYKMSHPGVIQHIIQESWLSIDQATDRRPDLAVYLSSGDPDHRIPERIPDLIFEIVSPGSDAHDRDYVEKRSDYERAGVREYVVVDRFEHGVTVFRPADGQFVATALTNTASYQSPLLPCLNLPLREII